MSPRLAFILNLDAEHELESGARWTTPQALAQKLDEIAAGMRLPEGAILVRPGMEVPSGMEARLWCPTPRAIALAERAGLSVPASPPVAIVKAVNERGFAAALAGDELQPMIASDSFEEIEWFVLASGPTGRWRLKRGLGASGRGQRSLAAGPLGEADRGWLARSLRLGRVYVEPELALDREVAVYGWVRPDGRVELTGLRGQTTDARGAFVRCGRIDARDLSGLATPFWEAAERVGAALFRAGYHGPFGTDGYTYRTPSGSTAVRALSEINARYCMGWDERDGF